MWSKYLNNGWEIVYDEVSKIEKKIFIRVLGTSHIFGVLNVHIMTRVLHLASVVLPEEPKVVSFDSKTN